MDERHLGGHRVNDCQKIHSVFICPPGAKFVLGREVWGIQQISLLQNSMDYWTMRTMIATQKLDWAT